MPNRLVGSLAALVSAFLLASCGGDGGNEKAKPGPSQFKRQLQEAQRVSSADFPPPRGRTLQELANTLSAQAQMGFATSVYTRGRNRLAFGILDNRRSFVYGKTAV